MTADHRCEPVYDTAGNVIGRALVDPGMSDAGRDALAALVAAVRREMAAEDDADPEAAAEHGRRQQAAVERIRAKVARRRGEAR